MNYSFNCISETLSSVRKARLITSNSDRTYFLLATGYASCAHCFLGKWHRWRPVGRVMLTHDGGPISFLLIISEDLHYRYRYSLSLPINLYIPHPIYIKLSSPLPYIFFIPLKLYIRNYALANNYDITGTFPIRVDKVNPSKIIYVIMPLFPSK